MSFAEERTVHLPGGYIDGDGACHREAVVRALRGHDEEWVASLAPDVPEPVFVTGLLGRAVRRVGPQRAGPALMRRLTVGDRDSLLLQVWRATFGSRVDLVLTCGYPNCGARMDAALEIDNVAMEAREVRSSYTLEAEGAGGIAFRLPLGEDQEAIAGWIGLGREEKRARLIQRCLLSRDDEKYAYDRRVQAAIAAALEQLAPKADFEIGGACPECGREFTRRLEPARWLLGELRRRLSSFEREVHLLSFHYHWPLRQVLALPRNRRVHYVGLLIREMDRSTAWAAGYA